MSDFFFIYHQQATGRSFLQKGLRLFWVGLFCLLLNACGYQSSGSQPLPTGVDTVAIHVVANRSRQTGLEVIMTNALVKEFVQHRKGMVVDETQAQSVLSGTILSMNTEVTSRTSTRIVAQRQITITLSLMLKNTAGAIIWRNNNLQATEPYSVTEDRIATEDNRSRAIGRAVQRLAEDAYNAMAHGF